MELKHRWVCFRVSDVHLPPAECVLAELHADEVLQGRVLDLSNDGIHEAAFAVVSVATLRQPLVVPIERLWIA